MSFQAQDILQRLRQNESQSNQNNDANDTDLYAPADLNELMHDPETNNHFPHRYSNYTPHSNRSSGNLSMPTNDSNPSNKEIKLSLHEKLTRNFSVFNQVR